MKYTITLVFFLGFWSFRELIAQTRPDFKESSLLAEGTIHKISVHESGVFRLDYNFIKDKLKVDPGSLSTNKIVIAGNRGGRIPQWSAAPRIDDLEQSYSWAVGLEDGHFDQGDYILWYAEGPDRWTFDTASRVYNQDKNIYDELNHYFIILNGPDRIAIDQRVNGTQSDYISNSSLFFQRFEEDKVNLLGRYRPPGSGQDWYGDELAVVKELDYTNKFDFTDFIPTDTFHFLAEFAVRAGSPSNFYVSFDNNEYPRHVGNVSLSSFEASYANDASRSAKFVPGQPFSKILMRYPTGSGVDSKAWVDYLQINGWKRNVYHPGNQLLLVDPRTKYLGAPEYQVENLATGALIWDISNPLRPIQQVYDLDNGISSFKLLSVPSINPSQFIVFHPSTDVKTPEYEEVISNQNLHSLNRADLLIVYHDDFEEAALLMADHRRNHSHFIVEAIPASKVFNEFGGGSRDPSAIRDFARMLYTRDNAFKYLLLIGDATYDFLNHSSDVPYQNFIPAFETEESLDPIRSFPSDDFFALLDEDEGDNLIGALDIAVGRFPISKPEEAMNIVNKIIYYDTNPLTLGDWRNRIVMVADDEDSNVHLNQADGLAVKTDISHPVFNQEKIYLDAYPQQVTPGGDRYPGVNEDIDLNMKKGALTITYLGHGGPNGWTQERVLGINQALSYDNLDNMPLYITATCSFAGYDEPGFTSTGEHLLLNPNGGAIGLMTTVRAVFSGSNERLTDEVLKIIYKPNMLGHYEGVGETLRRSKNANAIDTLDTNARKFTLLGDPSMVLAIPEFKVAVTEIQHHPVDIANPDTLSALEAAVVSGIILDEQDNWLQDFNGTLYLTVFDKPQIRRTLANDDGSQVRNFTTQTRQLFKGISTIDSGRWTIEFVLPKDIDFSYGNGKMSMYAENGETDASGNFEGFIIGGVSEDGLTDNVPPVIRLYMNDNKFISGGITDGSPDIYAELMDDNGINVSGTSVGHDLEAVLDGDDVNSFILNDFYQAALNDHTRGTVRFPLSDLTPGVHTLDLTAWDLANNAAHASIEFLVLPDGQALITKVSNNPNPVSNGSTSFSFEHNRAGTLLDVEINIYSMDGRLVSTLNRDDYQAEGYRVNDISWHADNDSGAPLPFGVYVYKVKASFESNGTVEVAESQPGKLVIAH